MTHPRESQMLLAIDHADARHEGWSEQAAAFLAQFSSRIGRFTGEDVTNAAKGIVPDPPTDRAWGGIFNRLSRHGIIRKTGQYSARVNGNAMPVWEVCR